MILGAWVVGLPGRPCLVGMPRWLEPVVPQLHLEGSAPATRTPTVADDTLGPADLTGRQP